MVARPWSSSRLSCGECLLLRCDGNAGNSFPTTQGKDPSSGARRRKRVSSGCGQDCRASSSGDGNVEELQGPATIPRVPQMYQSIPEKRVFPAQPRLSIRGSTHITVARGTPLWESLVGKPRGKVTDPLSHAKERVTLLLLLERKANVHAPTRDKD